MLAATCIVFAVAWGAIPTALAAPPAHPPPQAAPFNASTSRLMQLDTHRLDLLLEKSAVLQDSRRLVDTFDTQMSEVAVEVDERVTRVRTKFDEVATRMLEKERKMNERVSQAEENMRRLVDDVRVALELRRQSWRWPLSVLGALLVLLLVAAGFVIAKTPMARKNRSLV
jgi:hypothetical protein